MQHSKFQGHSTFGSEEEKNKEFLPCCMAVILVMRPRPSEQTFVPLPQASSQAKVT